MTMPNQLAEALEAVVSVRLLPQRVLEVNWVQRVSALTAVGLSQGCCRTALKTEDFGNSVDLQHLNRIRAQAPCT